MKKKYKILLFIVLFLGIIQLIPIDKTTPPLDKRKNFVDIENTPKEIRNILRKSCYDCHSNEVIYPWYSDYAPISWSIQHHIKEGRAHLNFSEWGYYNSDVKRTVMQQSSEAVLNFQMPTSGYLAQHPEAKLTEEQRIILSKYFGAVADKSQMK